MASATYEVIQGDTLYLGETVDISRVMSWSGQFAYFTSNEPGDYPAKIIDVNDVGHMYNYYIDPTKYIVGTWYKWDGKDENAGNMLAFYIAPGIRNNTLISQINPTTTLNPTPIQTMTLPAKIPQNTHLLLARGDIGSLHYGLPYNQSYGIKQQANLWLFGNSPDESINQANFMTTGTLMGVPMNYTSNDGVYSFTFTPEISRNLQEGWYSGYFQFSGLNQRQDVYYETNHKVGDYRNTILETPYDDDKIPDVPLEGFIPFRIQQEFEKLESNSEYSDDILVPITVEVVTPTISIGDYWESNGNITIQGSTPMSEGTIITVMIDPDHYALLPEIRAHTFRTITKNKIVNGVEIKEAECITIINEMNDDGYNATMYNGTLSKGIQIGATPTKTKCTSVPRIYSISIPIKWNEMAIGSHTIYASIDAYGIKTSMNKDFQVTGEWVNPTPTKEFNKLIMVKEGESHLVNRESGLNVNSNGFPNQTAIITPEVTQPEDVIIFMNQTGNNTIQSTPIQTPVPTPIPTPVHTPAPVKETQSDNPLLWLIAIGVIIAVIIGWLYWG